MEDWLTKSSWQQAKAAQERAKGRLGDRGFAYLQARLDQGVSDLRMAEKLEMIRLDLGNLVDAKINLAQADAKYEEVFAAAGFGRVGDDAVTFAQRVRASNISNTLLAALDHWSICGQDARRREWVLQVAANVDPAPTGWRARARDPAIRKDPSAVANLIHDAPVTGNSVSLLVALGLYLKDSKQRVPFLKRVQQAHPDDLWANITLGDALRQANESGEALRYYQTATALRPGLFIGYHYIGLTLTDLHRFEEAVWYFRKATEMDSAPGPAHLCLCALLSHLRRYDEAIVEFNKALLYRPDAAVLHTSYAMTLEAVGKLDEARVQHQRAVALEPTNKISLKDFRDFSIRQGRLDDARDAWAKALEARPSEHEEWYGYAELCLFLGQEEEYRRARQALLAKFGASTDLHVAERTSRACLLLPACGEELRQAVALAGRAAAADRAKNQGAYPFFQFAQGLAEYRQGRFDRAMSVMRLDASGVPGPSPRLVLAMALHRSGQETAARKTLATTILAHDWRANQIRDQDGWIYHVLRREAERLILPNLPAFLEGKYQPQDNDERFALLGVCQFTNRSAAMARLYADAFDAAPQQNLARHRYNAARAAALAGCGQGEDAARLEDREREKWRTLARQWLRADLAGWKKLLDDKMVKAATRDRAHQLLTQWHSELDLAGLREPAELLKLSAEERQDCIALWDDVRRAIETSQAK